jgi:hypothetical protein
VGAALLAALAATAACVATGCTAPHGGGQDGRGGHADRPGRESGQPRTPRSGHTGPLLAVKIDNVAPARPQTGLAAADVVYAEQVEGGLSRLLAVYATKLPPVVGPVRSARESDLELLRQFGRPTLAFSGAQARLLPLIDAAPLTARTPDDEPDAYFRAAGRAAPHNLFVRPNRLLAAAPGADALPAGFRYGPAPAGGRPVASRTVRYPAARFTFTWSAPRRGWQVAMDGAAATTTDGGRPAPGTVVVQHVRVRRSSLHDRLGNYTPYTRTVGSGTAQVLRDGRVYEAVWKRPRASDGTDFTTADGAPVNFAAGQVWVVFVPDR